MRSQSPLVEMSNLILFVKLSEGKKSNGVNLLFRGRSNGRLMFKNRLGDEAGSFGYKCAATWAHDKEKGPTSTPRRLPASDVSSEKGTHDSAKSPAKNNLDFLFFFLKRTKYLK